MQRVFCKDTKTHSSSFALRSARFALRSVFLRSWYAGLSSIVTSRSPNWKRRKEMVVVRMQEWDNVTVVTVVADDGDDEV